MEEGNRRRIKQEKYPTYCFSLNRETQGLQQWLDDHKAGKRMPAVVRTGLLLVRMLEEAGCPVPEDDPQKLRLFLDLLAHPTAKPPASDSSRPPVISAGQVKEEEDPQRNVDEFLESL